MRRYTTHLVPMMRCLASTAVRQETTSRTSVTFFTSLSSGLDVLRYRRQSGRTRRRSPCWRRPKRGTPRPARCRPAAAIRPSEGRSARGCPGPAAVSATEAFDHVDRPRAARSDAEGRQRHACHASARRAHGGAVAAAGAGLSGRVLGITPTVHLIHKPSSLQKGPWAFTVSPGSLRSMMSSAKKAIERSSKTSWSRGARVADRAGDEGEQLPRICRRST